MSGEIVYVAYWEALFPNNFTPDVTYYIHDSRSDRGPACERDQRPAGSDRVDRLHACFRQRPGQRYP